MTLPSCPSVVFGGGPPLQSPPAAVPNTPVSQQQQSSVSPVLYPVVYVSPAGLLTVLMRYDVAVEMTLDRAIRVVNHAHKAVAATNGRGNASCIYHVAAKIYQDRTSTQLELYGGRRAKMTTEVMEFGTVAGTTLPGAKMNQAECYRLTQYGLKANPTPDFTDLSQDMSVTLLFSSSGYGPHLIAQYEDVAQVCCTHSITVQYLSRDHALSGRFVVLYAITKAMYINLYNQHLFLLLARYVPNVAKRSI